MTETTSMYRPRKGVFKPKNLTNLKPGAQQYIGAELYFYWAWVIDSNDSSEYDGQVAYTMHPDEDALSWLDVSFTWCPEEDIEWLDTTII